MISLITASCWTFFTDVSMATEWKIWEGSYNMYRLSMMIWSIPRYYFIFSGQLCLLSSFQKRDSRCKRHWVGFSKRQLHIGTWICHVHGNENYCIFLYRLYMKMCFFLMTSRIFWLQSSQEKISNSLVSLETGITTVLYLLPSLLLPFIHLRLVNIIWISMSWTCYYLVLLWNGKYNHWNWNLLFIIKIEECLTP